MGEKLDKPKTALDAQRGNIFILEPERIKIATDPKQPCYDQRVMKPITAQWVRNLKKRGVRKPIHVWKDGDDVWAVDGRRRLRGLIKANEEIVAEGGVPHKVKVLLERGTADEMFQITVLTNEGHEEDDLLTRAEKAKRLLDMNLSMDDIADIFTRSAATVGRWLKLLDLDPEVQAKVRDGSINASMAIELAALPREKQRESAVGLIGVPLAVAQNVDGTSSPPVPEKLTAERVREHVARQRDPKAVKASETKRKLLQLAMEYAENEDEKLMESLVKAAIAYAKSRRKLKAKVKEKANA